MLFLRDDLIKGDGLPKQKAGAGKSPPTSPKSDKGQGEQRGGQYVARVQVGVEKDGSPKYRYFKTEDEYEVFLQNRGRSKPQKQRAEELKQKVASEHEESTKKTTKGTVVHEPAKAKSSLLSAGGKDSKLVKKSLRLFVEV